MKVIAGALIWLFSLTAQASSFSERCERLAASATIRVVFEDTPVIRSDSHSIDELTRLAGPGANRYHSVLGTTHAEPAAKLAFAMEFLNDGAGRTCAAPSFTLQLGFSRLEVNLAHELTNPCRQQIVYDHEQEHVAVWRNHLRISARLLTNQMTDAYARPVYFRTPAEAENVLRERINQHIASAINNIREGISNANQQIDSPLSYLHVESRLRACP